jgi:hypothetical protein
MINEASAIVPIPSEGPSFNDGGEVQPIQVDFPEPLPNPRVPVITVCKVITSVEILDWEHLDVMAYGLLKAMDYGYRSERAAIQANRIKEELMPVSRATGWWRTPPKTQYISRDPQVNNEARLKRITQRSDMYNRLAANQIAEAMPIFIQYMKGGNFGDLLYSVLQRVDQPRCITELSLAMENIFPNEDPLLMEWE